MPAAPKVRDVIVSFDEARKAFVGAEAVVTAQAAQGPAAAFSPVQQETLIVAQAAWEGRGG
jgi:hypothetical protein